MNPNNLHNEKLALGSKIEEQITDQIRAEQGPKQKPVPPLESPVIAQQHTPVYQMHRYFARRPWNVFEHIIQHYTNAGDLILDPFCGGGVTVYEGLKIKRKVIGVDLNPLAAWITKMQVASIDLNTVEIAFQSALEKFQPFVNEMYSTTCEGCGEPTLAEWFEWSNVSVCPGCGKEVVLAQAKKLKNGTYECPTPKCLSRLVANDCARKDDTLINKKLKCSNCGEKISSVSEADFKKARKYEREFNRIVAKENLFVPAIPFPDGDRARDDAIFNKGVKTFSDLFTRRNLIAMARLKNIIRELSIEESSREVLLFIFSAALRYVNKMVFRNEIWRPGGALEWAGHAYWLPNSYIERNPIWALENRKNAFVRGKKQANTELVNFVVPFSGAKAYTYQIWTQSSEKLPLPYKSVDCIITDPPFGGNVQYAELSDFWVVWFPELFDLKDVIDNSKEAITTRHQGFPTEKNLEHYENLLYSIFKECHRVLKDSSYMVMTFHNRDVSVWMALHRAARRAGFDLPSREEVDNHGMVYQDFIENFKQTFHIRASGSLLGDFILTFKKGKIPSHIEDVIYDLTTTQQKEIIKRITDAINYHGGLDNTTMGNMVVEILADLNLLHRFAGSDLSTIYKAHFLYSKKENKWYTREMVDPENISKNIYDIWPVEEAVERILYDYFNDNKYATEDQLLFFIFRRLVNSKRPGMDVVKKVLKRCTDKKRIKREQREVYLWKVSRPQPTLDLKDKQICIFEGKALDHNTIIAILAKKYLELTYQIHIGLTETKKDEGLRKLSQDLNPLVLGLPQNAYNILKEIDLLVLRGNTVQKAIEVVTTFSTFNRAINERFRNLLTAAPNLNIELEVYLPKNDFEKARKELDSPANIREGLNKKVKLMEINPD